MVRASPRALQKTILVLILCLIAGALLFVTVNAQGDNQFPGLTGRGADWDVNRNSPDPNLSWLYKSNDVINGKAAHILRTRFNGRNEGTRLRLYFSKQPKKISISLNVIICELNAPGGGGGESGFDGEMFVRLGGQKVYSVRTHDNRYNNSPVCVDHGNDKRKLDGERFTIDYQNGYTRPDDPNPDPEMGLDPLTGLYFADLDIDLTSDTEDRLPSDRDLMQKITFNVKAENSQATDTTTVIPKMGYRFDQFTQGSRFFGLQGNAGRENDYNGYGAKYAVPFGRNCTDDRPTVSGPVEVYDPDVRGYGKVYMKVLRRKADGGSVEVLKRGDFEDAGFRQAVYRDNNEWIEATADNNKNSSFVISNLEEGYQYMLLIINPNDDEHLDPSSNVFSLRLPANSINGLIACKTDLEPKLGGVSSTFSAYGDVLTPHGWIQNGIEGSSPGEHTWRVTRFVYDNKPSDFARDKFLDADQQPCAFETVTSGPYKACDKVHEGIYPDDDDWPGPDAVGAYAPGTYVCYLTSIKDATSSPSDNNKWRHSAMQCSVAGIKPKLQVWGGDAKVFGGIDTSTTMNAAEARHYGSWGEYGLFSNGRNTTMASGGGLNGGGPNSQGNWSTLTFANTGPFFGVFGGVTLPDYNAGDATENTCRLDAATYGANDKRVIQCDGTLTIAGNQSYSNQTYGSVGAVPSVKIVADNIIIEDGVSQIDPWVIARSSTGTFGKVSTCNKVPDFLPFGTLTGAELNSTRCNTQLRFNGPVVADQLYAYRTFDQAKGDPAAETFNLRADNFLSSYAGRGADRPVARTELITELPPRF